MNKSKNPAFKEKFSQGMKIPLKTAIIRLLLVFPIGTRARVPI
jgi:hypothetical protein